MYNNMMELQIDPFIKYIVLKMDLLYDTRIIDEANFSIDDTENIARFVNKYSQRSDCVIVEIEI